MRSRPRHRAAWAALLASAAVGSACGRVGLTTKRASRPDLDAALVSDSTSHPSGDAETREDSRTHRDDGSVPREAAPEPTRESGSSDARADGRPDPSRDAPAEGSDGESRSDGAPHRDAPSAPDCRCPPDDYHVDFEANGARFQLSFAYPLFLYCDETEPQLAHPPCGSVYRLSACAGPKAGPPCLYLAIDGTAPVIGIFIDATGQTFSLVGGEIASLAASERLATGSFSAIYASQTSETSIRVSGTFRACTTAFEPCNH